MIRLAYSQALVAVDREVEAANVLQQAIHRFKERSQRIESAEWRKAFAALPDHDQTLCLMRTLQGTSTAQPPVSAEE